MGLINCSTCNAPISDKAVACPRCGTVSHCAEIPQAKPIAASVSQWRRYGLIFFLVVLVFSLVIYLHYDPSHRNSVANTRLDVDAPIVNQQLTNEEKIELRRIIKHNSTLVVAKISDTTYAKGSGFVVKRLGEKCIVLTNAHVVTEEDLPAKAIQVKPPSMDQYLGARLLFYVHQPEENLDFAFLVVHDPTNALGQEVEFARSVSPGDYVVSVGNPLEEEFLVDDGNVIKVVQSSSGRTIYHNTLIEHGSSGGGLFNSRAQLVGINTYLGADNRTGIAIFSEVLLSRMRFYSVEINARDDWQESGIQIAKDTRAISLLAEGTWSASFFLPPLDAKGMAGYEQYSLLPSISHGALLAQVGRNNDPIAVNGWWKTADPDAAGVAMIDNPGQEGDLRLELTTVILETTMVL